MDSMKHILFDFDGTIADSEQAALGIINQIADRHGYRHLRMDEVESLRRMPIRDRFRILGLPMRKLPGWAKEYNDLFSHAVGEVNPIAGMPELIEDLHRKGYVISILSSNAEDNIRYFLERHAIHQVREVLCSHRIFSKARMIRRHMRRNRLSADDLYYVGDEHRDVVACKKAGVPVIWVRWGFDGFEAVASAQPEFVAEKPEDILGIVGGEAVTA